ncbi:hypothetical protein VTP01DRAFT_6572 [Rhizomucor pusillus]|uniref:uncharacterized protein n=1 Tax=Rhizomucor pusillus TaxID=4840 RepID=UPI0037420596
MASRALFKPQLSRSFRRFTTAVSEVSETKVSNTEFAKQRDGVKHHAAQSASTWQKICLFVCIPSLLATGANAYNLYQQHQEHVKHHPPKFVNYEYRNWRVRDFFWGKDSLFFNPKVNHSVTED